MSVALQLLLVVAATVTVASATPVAGTLNFSGTAVVSLLGIDFVPPPGAGVGQIVVLPGGNTGDFAFLNAGVTTGQIVDRDPSQQAGIPLNIANWLTVPNFAFTLQFIRPGSFNSVDCFAAAANQQSCTPPPFDPDGAGPQQPILSPYNLTNSIDSTGNISSKGSFYVSGNVTNLMNPLDMGTFEGEFTTVGLNLPYQTLLNTVLAGGTVTVPFAASITVTPPAIIPEPSSMALALGGAVLLGAGLLRRRRRQF
jgi:hypothetical protein